MKTTQQIKLPSNQSVVGITSSTKFSSNADSQRSRLFKRLQSLPLTTLQAREELDIYHPAARVQELREAGYDIATNLETISTDRGKHRRVARYVLLSANSIC